jgi:hypothetical protein
MVFMTKESFAERETKIKVGDKVRRRKGQNHNFGRFHRWALKNGDILGEFYDCVTIKEDTNSIWIKNSKGVQEAFSLSKFEYVGSGEGQKIIYNGKPYVSVKEKTDESIEFQKRFYIPSGEVLIDGSSC